MKDNATIITSPISFKRQLLSLFAISVIVLTVTTSILTAWQSSQTLKDTIIDNALKITDNFADQSVLALLTGSKENGEQAIKHTLGFTSVLGVGIYQSDGEELVISEKATTKRLPFSVKDFTEKTQLLSEDDNLWIFTSAVTFSEDISDFEMTDPNEEVPNQQLVGYVIIQYDKRALHQVQRTIFINNISTGALVALLLSLLIRTVINRLTTPLLSLSNTMESARVSGLYHKAQVEGALEIRQMAQRYNQMMTTLEQQNTALENSRNTLESEVEIRTQELIVARDSALTASRHKSEFLANISHELRTPLQAIIGYSDLVREDLELECMDAQVDDLNKCIRNAHSLLSLINNILDLAKIEAGRMDLFVKAVNIKNLINETIDTVQPMANANHNELIVNIGELTSILYVDRQKLMQIFLNLLSNACKFTKNGTITFDIYSDNNHFCFSVKDSGVGIAQDKLDFIFEQFTQIDGSQTRQFEGTGLGMAITQNFCQLMKAKITVESKIGQGSLFTVTMPIQKENSSMFT